MSPITTDADPIDLPLSEETAAHMRDLMREAVREGLREALSDEAVERFWTSGLSMLQRQAAQQTGRFVLGGLAGIMRKAGMFLVLGGVVYAIGGWTALATLAKAVLHGSGSAAP